MAEHTKTPWTLGEFRNFTGTFVFWVYYKETRIFSIRENSDVITEEQFKANAKFIVKACNAYDSDQETIKGLRATVRMFVTALDRHPEDTEVTFRKESPFADTFRKALKLAEQE